MALLEEALRVLTGVYMRLRYDIDDGDTTMLNSVGKVYLNAAFRAHGMDLSGVTAAMAGIALRLASMLTYDQVLALTARIAGDNSSPNWGQRLSAVQHSFSDCRSRDGTRWIS